MGELSAVSKAADTPKESHSQVKGLKILLPVLCGHCVESTQGVAQL